MFMHNSRLEPGHPDCGVCVCVCVCGGGGGGGDGIMG